MGDSCNFTCLPGYAKHGEHLCDVDGGFRGGPSRPLYLLWRFVPGLPHVYASSRLRQALGSYQNHHMFCASSRLRQALSSYQNHHILYAVSSPRQAPMSYQDHHMLPPTLAGLCVPRTCLGTLAHSTSTCSGPLGQRPGC